MSLKVTIGLCTKNSEKTIKESVESIINQKYPSELIQLINVDGHSTDKTMSIIGSLTAKTGVKVETYSDNGSGVAAARQIVVSKASAKYIIFVDSDVKLFDDFVKNHVKFMEENPNVGVAFGKPMYQEGTLVESVWNLYQFIEGGSSGCGANIYRVEALRQTGGFDPKIKGAGEDDDLIFRIRAKGWLVSMNENARFFHKNRDNIIDFLVEQSWFGYGNHYFSHKTGRHPTWRQNLIGFSRYGLKMAFKAYKQTHRMISFLIPVHVVLGRISWWFGFFKGHMNGYGHKIDEGVPLVARS